MSKYHSMHLTALLKRLKFSQFVVKNKHLLSTNNLLAKQLPLNTKRINCRYISYSCQSLPVLQKRDIIVTKMTSEHIYTNDTPVIQLDAEKAFNALTDGEKLYAHFLSKSSWFGSLIVLFQTSPESPLIFTLFRRLFNEQSLQEVHDLAKNVAKFDDEEWRALLVYLSAFLANMGNYRGFGDSKFIPDLPKDKLETLIVNSKAFKTNKQELQYIWDQIKNRIYSLQKNDLALGFAPNGTTTYFSKNCSEDDSKLVKEFMELNKIDAYNTRVFKDSETNTFEIRFASVLTDADNDDSEYLKLKTGNEFKGSKFVLSRGDYSPILKIMNQFLIEAQNNARNEAEKKMIAEYVRHFLTGDLKYHKDGSRYWIKDKGPIVETYIGFIENYRDPAGQRAEFEGFVSIVNKEMSKKFESLVSSAASFLPLLPWPKDFEKDRFLQPDFTSLDVLTFSGSGIPAGINIPNYDEIRQNEGFKNVSLGNVITASFKEPKPNFLSEDDAKIMEKYSVHSFEVQVGLHELLGHGSGKLLKMDDSKPNFDENTVNPLTQKKVDKWYGTGMTYDSVFTSLASAYEECRAECVGLYLCLEPNVMKIFGFTGAEAENVIYVNWLSMVHKGIASLQMYNPEIKKWLQAHSQARYVITRVLLEASKDLVNIKHIEKSSKDGKPDLLISFTNDQKLIQSEGKEAIGAFLLKLQVFKSLADIKSAQDMFDKYSEVSDDLEYPYLKYRNIVMERKKPRKIFVESSTKLSDGKVVLTSHPPTHEGMIDSFSTHLEGITEDIDQIIVDLYRKDFKHFV